MEKINKQRMVCKSCGKEHEVLCVLEKEKTLFKGQEVTYDALYYYCDIYDEYYEDEALISKNQCSLRDEYRKMHQLLTSNEIIEIRNKYLISQKELSKLLGWSPATITRYENYQVQDRAHDEILRKLSQDPKWFLELLVKNESLFSKTLYKKYFLNAKNIIYQNLSSNVEDIILYQYKNIEGTSYCGNTALNLRKTVDLINYISSKIENLYKTKLVKLMWYCDSLFYKKYDHSLTGIAYLAEQWGALPLCHDEIMKLPHVHYETIEQEMGYGYRFYPEKDYKYNFTQDEYEIIDQVIDIFKSKTREEIVARMHKEDAYICTEPQKLIDYSLVKTLSI